MQRHLLPCIASALMLIMMLGGRSISPRLAHAISPDVRVWVVDDQTAESHCMMNDAPCQAEAMRVLWVHKVTLATATAEHRPYISGDASPAMLRHFVHLVAPLPQPSSGARPMLTCIQELPRTDTGTITLGKIGSQVKIQMQYNVFANCSRQAVKLSLTFVSGHGTWKGGSANALDQNGTRWDTDNDSGCNGLSRSTLFGRNNISTTLPMKTEMDLFSGGACTILDGHTVVDFVWTE